MNVRHVLVYFHKWGKEIKKINEKKNHDEGKKKFNVLHIKEWSTLLQPGFKHIYPLQHITHQVKCLPQQVLKFGLILRELEKGQGSKDVRHPPPCVCHPTNFHFPLLQRSIRLSDFVINSNAFLPSRCRTPFSGPKPKSSSNVHQTSVRIWIINCARRVGVF
jgi:hypothetical protein